MPTNATRRNVENTAHRAAQHPATGITVKLQAQPPVQSRWQRWVLRVRLGLAIVCSGWMGWIINSTYFAVRHFWWFTHLANVVSAIGTSSLALGLVMLLTPQTLIRSGLMADNHAAIRAYGALIVVIGSILLGMNWLMSYQVRFGP